MKPVDFLSAARRDYDESFDWYAQRSLQTAERFERAVEKTLLRIAENPEGFAAVGRHHRGCPVPRFPFRLIYRIQAERILVVAVAHAKRRPNYWTKRH